jgi:hypothetical protein
VNSHVSERERLIALLAALADPPRAAALPTDDPLLIAVARHHRLSPLLSITCGDTLPSALAEACRRDRVVTAARNMILGQVAEECLGALAAAGIPTILLKGLDYETRLYRVAGARPTADIDLLVPDEKRRNAFGVLDRLGFEPRAAAPGFDDPDYHEVAWTRAGAEVDLHLALAPLARCAIDYRAVWRAAVPLQIGGAEALALEQSQAAIFHALHMAIDHFDVPAIYLLDLARLLPDDETVRAAQELATRWRCRRPLDTATALTAALLSHWRGASAAPSELASMRARIVQRYGTTTSLPRPEQLMRKLLHFDSLVDAADYLLTQSRRNLREQIERRTRRRSARRRLNLVALEPVAARGPARVNRASSDLEKIRSPK